MKRVTVQVPATSANLGPGFDCLGLALRLYNRIRIERDGDPCTDRMALAAADAFFALTKAKPFSFNMTINGDVPPSRGLGSSVTVRLGVLAGLNELSEKPLSRQQLFGMCAQLEGHPDNAAPATFGGFTVATGKNMMRFPVRPSLHIVLLIPDFAVSTAQARKVLPTQVSLTDASASNANACRITAAFAARKYEQLRGSFGDYLHQPYRQRLVPFLPAVIAAAEKAGALGGFLSGSGSTIACLTLVSPQQVAAAMLKAAGEPWRCVSTRADNRGLRIL